MTSKSEIAAPAQLRKGWTTGACATAAARAAYEGHLTGFFPDPVSIMLPGGQRAAFALATCNLGMEFATVGVVKDAGDDPDVTHGALILVTVRDSAPGSGVTFTAGPGVGTITRPGLPLPPGEPAINPVPRAMIRATIDEVAQAYGATGDIVIEISIPGGEKIAERTLNARLGIIGGLSILGTTGIVKPYSCSAWIHSIHRGIDVARAAGLDHVAGATGNTSEAAIKALHDLPDVALIDMGDFVGGMLKYLRKHPVAKVSIAGGIAKMSKLGQGLLDLHSRRGEVDFDWLAERVAEAGGKSDLVERVRRANTALEVLEMAQAERLDIGRGVAEAGWRVAADALRGADIALEIAVFDRQGRLIGRTEFRPIH